MLRAFIAADKLAFIDRDDDAYARVAKALRAKGTVEEARKAADDYLKNRTDKKASDFAAVLGDMQEKTIFDNAFRLFTAGLEEGADIGRAGEKALNRARRAVVGSANGTDYATMVADTGTDLVASILDIAPEKFAPPDAEEDGMDGGSSGEGARPEFVGPPTEEQMKERQREIDARDAMRRSEFIQMENDLDNARRKDDERRAQREEDKFFGDEGAKPDEGGKPAGGEAEEEAGDNEEGEDTLLVTPDMLKQYRIDIRDAHDLALLFAVRIDRWLARRPSEGPLSQTEKGARFTKSMKAMLERKIGEIEDAMPRRSVMIRAEHIPGMAQKHIVRQTKKEILAAIGKNIDRFIGRGKEIDKMELEMGRKILGQYAQTARFIRKVAELGPERAQRLQDELEDVIAGRKAALEEASEDAGEALAAETDETIHRATEQLQLLARFGNLKQHGPAEMLKLAAEIQEYLETGKAKHEAKWGAYKMQWDGLHVLFDRRRRKYVARYIKAINQRCVLRAIRWLIKHGDLDIVRSVTTDNGCEFLDQKSLDSAFGALVYYTRAYAAWEKGSVENCNRILRRWFPKGTDFSLVRKRDIAIVIGYINSIHRKTLGWLSADEISAQEAAA